MEATTNTGDALVFNLSDDGKAKLLDWLASGDTGMSSKTIAKCAIGRKPDHDWSIPYDSDDFSRCYRLLQLIPELRGVLPVLAQKFPMWAPLVAEWDELTAMYEQDQAEAPQYERVSMGRGRKARMQLVNKRRCYDRLHELHDACYVAGGWVKTGQSCWQKEVK